MKFCAICLFWAQAALANNSGKDLNEFVPPLRPAVKRSIGAEDIAKANAKVSDSKEPAWRSGIIDSGLAPFPAALYNFENQWHEILNGEHVKVYAGAPGQDPSQGVVVIQILSLDNQNVGAPRVVEAPRGVGSLRITGAKGAILTLRSSQGIELTLNAETGQLTKK